MFPAATAKRADFEQIVRAVDKMFFSEENSKLWCIGVEGTTYTMDGDKIVYADNIKKAAEQLSPDAFSDLQAVDNHEIKL